MKKLVKKKDVECMACLDCVRACSEAFFKVFDGDKSCIQVIMKKGAATPSVCIQCGKCAKACEHEAITQNSKGVYLINKKQCVGCGACVEACPLKLMVLDTQNSVASKCIVCGKCVKACPMECLEIAG